MSSPAPVDVGDALDDLINQFSDPMSFFRELIQNALDAGSDMVEVDFEFEPSAKDPDTGAMIVVVADSGEGMDREIIDNKLTRLFSSGKDGDMTKIGKFGIGFVSVFAINPDAVCVDTARAGEAWRVLFDRERNFKRLRLDQAIEGTTIRIIKNSNREEFERFVARAKQVIRYWCGHAKGEVLVAGELVTQPFGLEAPLVIDYQDEFSHIYIGHQPGGATLHGFFNGGLTLVQADHNHGSAIAELVGVSFKVNSRYLEHTLTRDDVIKDGHFGKVVKRLQELARNQLRERVLTELDAAVRGEWPLEPGPAAETLQLLYEAAAWHLGDGRGVARKHAKLAAARAPSGRVWTWAELRAGADEGVWVASERTPLSDAVEALERVVIRSYAGVVEDREGPLAGTVVRPLLRCVELVGGPAHDRIGWLAGAWFMPVVPELGERLRWQGLANMTRRLLDDCGFKVEGVEFGRFAASGSDLGGRAIISQARFGEATPAAEAAELGTRLWSRPRFLVGDADHPTIRKLLALSTAEPELASYQLAKLFLLASGSIDAERDSELADRAMALRELRCPRPMS